jgi:hypothetical protein
MAADAPEVQQGRVHLLDTQVLVDGIGAGGHGARAPLPDGMPVEAPSPFIVVPANVSRTSPKAPTSKPPGKQRHRAACPYLAPQDQRQQYQQQGVYQDHDEPLSGHQVTQRDELGQRLHERIEQAEDHTYQHELSPVPRVKRRPGYSPTTRTTTNPLVSARTTKRRQFDISRRS